MHPAIQRARETRLKSTRGDEGVPFGFENKLRRTLLMPVSGPGGGVKIHRTWPSPTRAATLLC
jgi:hypothetical protein